MTNIIPTKTENGLSAAAENSGAHCFSDLAIALIKFCSQDGNEASSEISERLGLMQAQIKEAKTLLESGADAAVVSEQLTNVSGEIMNTVMSLQFFDRISQRMEHAVESIEAISEPASEKAKTLAERFTMDDERILYDALLEGCSVEDALDRAGQKLNDTIESHGSDIELF